MHTRTRLNIEAALAGEALAALRYQLFADQAEHEGYGGVRELFATSGRLERTEHFRELAALVELVSTTRENLRAAIVGEVSEHRSLYPRFASQARQDGDVSVAERFQELGAVERRHANRLRDAFEAMQVCDLEVVGG